MTIVSRNSVSRSALNDSGVQRVDDDARQAGGVEDAFFEVEVPRPVLLRHQAALQAVGEAADGALEMGELLVEIGAQAVELGGVAAGPRP